MSKISKKMLLLAVLLCGLLLPQHLSALPLIFRQTRGIFAANIETFDIMAGRYGDAASWGLGISVEAALQASYFGAAFRLGMGRGLTENKDIPYNSGYSMRYLSAGPRFAFPLLRRTMLAIILQPEISLRMPYSDTILLANDEAHYLGCVGGGIAIQFFLGSLMLTGSSDAHWSWETNSVFLYFRLGIGVGASF